MPRNATTAPKTAPGTSDWNTINSQRFHALTAQNAIPSSVIAADAANNSPIATIFFRSTA